MLMSTKGEQGLEVEKFSEVSSLRFQTQWVTEDEAGVGFCPEYWFFRLWFTAVNGSR